MSFGGVQGHRSGSSCRKAATVAAVMVVAMVVTVQ